MLPAPVRSRKYQEGPDAAERRPREGGHSPLDSADVQVQVPRTVGDFSPGAHREPRGAPLPILHSILHGPPGSWARPLQGAEIMALGCPLGPGGHRDRVYSSAGREASCWWWWGNRQPRKGLQDSLGGAAQVLRPSQQPCPGDTVYRRGQTDGVWWTDEWGWTAEGWVD